MSDDKELEKQEATNEPAIVENPDYLQEGSEIIAGLESKLKNNDPKELTADDTSSPSEKVEKNAKQHITNLETELANMRERGDYGIPNIDSSGEPMEGDISFLGKKAEIPEDLKKEMD